MRVTTFVADQENLSAEVAARQLKLGFVPGVRYLEGGWQSLVNALAAKAEATGATLRTRSAVRALHQEAGGWTAALDEETLHADVLVVAAGGPDAVAKLFGGKSPAAPRPRGRAERARPRAAQPAAADAQVCARRRQLHLPLPALPARPSRRRPAQPRQLCAGTTRRRWRRWPTRSSPAGASRLIFDRFLPRMVPITAIATPDSGGLAGQPEVDRGDGLYLAGDWIGPEGWLVDAAIASGAAAATAALRQPVSAPA